MNIYLYHKNKILTCGVIYFPGDRILHEHVLLVIVNHYYRDIFKLMMLTFGHVFWTSHGSCFPMFIMCAAPGPTYW